MKKRVTTYDISRELGVSPSTVNRALNGNTRISEETRHKVLKTASAMGFKTNRAAKSLSRKPIKIGFIMTSNLLDFHSEVFMGVKAAYEELSDFNISFDYYITTQPMYSQREEILDKMLEMGNSGYDGILIIPVADLRGFHQVISELADKKVAVGILVGDIIGSRRTFTVQQNSILMGRIAAELLWWFAGGKKAAIFTSHKDLGVHAEIIEGFFKELKKKPLELTGIYESHDNPDLAYDLAQKFLSEHPDTNGIYISTANSSSICRCIEERGLGGKIKIVASDIFPQLRRYIEDDIVHASIFQDPFYQGKLAFRTLFNYLEEGVLPNDNILIKPQIILSSNLDEFL